MRMLCVSLVLSMTLALPAAASDKGICSKAFESSQSLRDEGKLTAAREQMLRCTQVCPAKLAKVCDGWVADVDKSLPSIVLRAIDGKGNDRVDVVVTIDGKVVIEKLDGKPLAIDPGTHSLKFETKGLPAVTQDIVVGQGEKNRAVVVTIAEPEAPKPVEKPPPPPPVAPAETKSAPVAAIVVGGIGVLAIGGFAYFGLKADSDHSALVDGCSRTASCTQEQKDGVVRDWRVADVFLVSGAVLIGVSGYLFLTHDSGGPKATVGLAPTKDGPRASFSLAF